MKKVRDFKIIASTALRSEEHKYIERTGILTDPSVVGLDSPSILARVADPSYGPHPLNPLKRCSGERCKEISLNKERLKYSA